MFKKKKIYGNEKKNVFSKENLAFNAQNNLSRKIKKYPKFFKIYKIFLIIFLIFLSFFIFFKILDLNGKSVINFALKPFSSELQKDENGLINILLIGVGGGSHDGPRLTDTMILASIDKNQKVSMLSVPRDFYVKYDRNYPQSRINEIFRNVQNRLKQKGVKKDERIKKARRVLMNKIGEITNMKIPYFVQIDFKGFTNIVNKIGGVKIDVEKSILDTTYPDGDWGYETFRISKGEQMLDGELALKYARSRHSTSDFDRAKRQQKIINAIKEKVLSGGTLLNPQKLVGVYNEVSKNIKTNFSAGEVLSLVQMASNLPKSSFKKYVLNDNLKSQGGFLLTPPRSEYGGAFVLIPYSGDQNFKRIHLFSEIIFQNKDLTNLNIEVLNATYIGGLAGKMSERVGRYGFEVKNIGNIKEKLKKTEIHIFTEKVDFKKIKKYWDEMFPNNKNVKIVNKIGFYEDTDIDLTIMVGSNIRF